MRPPDRLGTIPKQATGPDTRPFSTNRPLSTNPLPRDPESVWQHPAHQTRPSTPRSHHTACTIVQFFDQLQDHHAIPITDAGDERTMRRPAFSRHETTEARLSQNEPLCAQRITGMLLVQVYVGLDSLHSCCGSLKSSHDTETNRRFYPGILLNCHQYRKNPIRNVVVLQQMEKIKNRPAI